MDPTNKVTENTFLLRNFQTVVTEHLYFTSCLALSEVAGKWWQKLGHLAGALGTYVAFPPSTLTTSAAEQGEGKQRRVSVIPIQAWVVWNLSISLLPCHLDIKSYMWRYSSRQRTSTRYPKISFPYFGSSKRKCCYCFQKYCFPVLVEIHNGNIMFHLHHKQKYLLLMG